MKRRTSLQRAADSMDCDLFRVLMRAEHTYDENKRDKGVRDVLGPALNQLRNARSGLRQLMHKDDRKGTEG
jgi:hypothetical protein